MVIDPAGYVLTNNHVVAPAADGARRRIEAIFHDGTRSAARIVGRDPKTDLAVRQGQGRQPGGRHASGTSSTLAVGDERDRHRVPARAWRAPSPTGIVSALDRPVRLDGSGDDATR